MRAEEYIKMGLEHTNKDVEISRRNLMEIEKEINGHAISWCKIWETGRNHKHGERIMSSKVTSSQNLALLYPLYKDHKKEPGKTRPVVTG